MLFELAQNSHPPVDDTLNRREKGPTDPTWADRKIQADVLRCLLASNVAIGRKGSASGLRAPGLAQRLVLCGSSDPPPLERISPSCAFFWGQP